MSLEDIIRQQAEKQLDKATKAVEDGEWFDSLITELKSKVDSAEMDQTSKDGANAVIASLETSKDKATGLGSDALTLLVAQLAAGREKDATETYLQAHGSADAIIEAMDRGTLGLIAAKQQIEQWQEDAWQLIKSITINGAKALLPMLLAI